jgi:hypothetical protein
VVARRQLALLAALDAVDRLLRVHEQAVVEILAVELRVGAERSDGVVGLWSSALTGTCFRSNGTPFSVGAAFASSSGSRSKL